MNDQNQQNSGYNDVPFDPTQDIDLSGLEREIVDTSKGDKIDYNEVAFNKVYRFKCESCGFVYEGANFLTQCPRCGSTALDDSEMTQTT